MEIHESINAQNGKVLFRNPDDKRVNSIQRMCERNMGYCPCEPIKNEDTLCPCRNAREKGECKCGLYVKVLSE